MIKKLLEKYKPLLVDYRRHFHKNPEVSWKEYKTSEFIKKELDRHGIPFKSIAKTGIEAVITGDHPGKTVALRGDIDALQVKEEATHEYKSVVEGVMHACGHDGHTAMLLCAAIVLNGLKSEIHGKVKLIFQPAEEMVEGAKKIIEEGGIDDVDAIFGIHLWSGLETGKIALGSGPRMASGDYVIINIIGKGGHGSMPHQTIDASLAAAAVVTNMQSLVSREINPLESVVLSFGEIRSGTRFNVLSGYAELRGTVRCFNPQIRDELPSIIKRHGEAICEAYRAGFELVYNEGTPPTINDTEIAEIGRRVITTSFSQDTLADLDKTTGSEDMAYYLERIPGAIAFVGAGNHEKQCDYPHHHPKFNIDEDSLAIGLELYVQFALSYLKKA